MAAQSNMLPLGTPLPDFTLPDVVTGRDVSTRDLGGRPVLVAFICNHCPYVKHVQGELAKLGRECGEASVAMVGISSNDVVAYPDDAPDKMATEASRAGYTFPYLFDESQDVARAFHAACTPELYLFDAGGKLRYRGQLDDSRPGNGVPVTGSDVRRALEALKRGERPDEAQKASVGCSIKWKKG